MQFYKTLTVLACAALFAGIGHAQETSDSTDGTADIPLSMGEEITEDTGPKVGETYVAETSGDWQVRCVRAPEGQKDPCQLYQLLRDTNDNPVAEINVLALPSTSQAAAGANIIVPLETLLTEQLRMTVDGRNARRYPFSFCTEVGCLARIGFSAEDVAAFKRGNKAELVIVPAAAPDQEVVLNVSLTGFTAGFAKLEELRSQ